MPIDDNDRPILIAYDGSDFAKAAIAAAASQLGPNRKAVVLTQPQGARGEPWVVVDERELTLGRASSLRLEPPRH